MIEFTCDYAEGAHENILNKLSETNRMQTAGYGEDPYCKDATKKIRDLIQKPDADIHFLVGGTQANLIVISSVLRPHQGVIAAQCGHIAVHETGAIEATGHKVITVPSIDGKITAKQIQTVYEDHITDVTHEHMVQPKVVYISNPTEYGMTYQLDELQAIHEVCQENGLFLYLDGARLAYGLTSENNTLDLPAIADLCDVFYIGGTKCGALLGEAVVITNPLLKQDFRYLIKQKGGLLAKGRLLGIQFSELFSGDLYFKLGRHGNQMAMKLKDAFLKQGWELYVDSYTNQQFPVIPNPILKQIEKKYTYSYIAPVDEKRSIVRFCTSWATREENIDTFLTDLKHWERLF